MISLMVRNGILMLSITCALHAVPDISNLNNCIKDVRQAENTSIAVPTFDTYVTNYGQLIADLEEKMPTLPFVYQEAAAKPLIRFLQSLGRDTYLQIFNSDDEKLAVFREMIPDAALSILHHEGIFEEGINAFQEIVSDLYDSFLSESARVGKNSGSPIAPPTYGVIPPLVKFGNAEYGPYTWTCDATSQVLGMKCAIVSLPPAQLKGGLIGWSCLGHETGGHDVLHADAGLLAELAQKVHDVVLKKFNSKGLATYWANCIDETAADVCGYLNMGPSAGIGLIGYFRALGNGKLRNTGSLRDPHPIDLLRGYLAAAVVKRLHFKDADVWSHVITKETHKDNNTLYLVDSYGRYYRFPATFDQAVASTEVVAQTILQSKLTSLQGHTLQKLQDWTDKDQNIVDNLAEALKEQGTLPPDLRGPKFYAAYVIAAATQAALEQGANIVSIFSGMQNFLATMHLENPTWSQSPTEEAIAYLEKNSQGNATVKGKLGPHIAFPIVPPVDYLLVGK